MKEILHEQLKEYLAQKKQKEIEAMALMKEGKEWRHIAREAAGFHLMILATIEKLKKYIV
jgi:hypothetical protein